jgi:DNA ligase-1
MRYLITFVSLLFLSMPLLALDKPQLMLANNYDKQSTSAIDLNDYWVSEKYDGVRAYWDGERFISRQGNQYHAPAWFTANFPNVPLDGELWLARGQFDRLSGIVRKKQPLADEWRLVRYMVFDMPKSLRPFDQRLKAMKSLTSLPAWLIIIPQWRVNDEAELLIQLESYVAKKAEGLMLHHGDSYYSAKRSNDLLKLKPSFDSEGIVIGYEEGKGKYTGMMGALWVEADISNEEGLVIKQRFKIGSGFTDKERQFPPELGSEITFKYSGLTIKGKPRFVRYWRMRLR